MQNDAPAEHARHFVGDARVIGGKRGGQETRADEAVRGWANQALEAGMRILPLDDEMLTKLSTRSSP